MENNNGNEIPMNVIPEENVIINPPNQPNDLNQQINAHLENLNGNAPISPSYSRDHRVVYLDSDDSITDDDEIWPNEMMSDVRLLADLGEIHDTDDEDSLDNLTVNENFSQVDCIMDSQQDNSALNTLSNNVEEHQDSSLKKKLNYFETCAVCTDSAVFVCGECRRLAYCSENHQLQDWENHRTACIHYALYRPPAVQYRGPFRVEKFSENDSFHLVAACNISSGTKILEEKPLLISPWPRLRLRKNELSTLKGLILRCLTCFGCCKYIGFNYVECENCNLPICSLGCTQIENHHKNECKFLKEMIDTGKINTKVNFLIKTFIEDENSKLMELLYTDVMILRLIVHLSNIGKQEGPAKQAEIWSKLCLTWKINEKKRAEISKTSKLVFEDIKKYLPISCFATSGATDYVWKLYCIIKSNAFQFDLPFRRFNALCTVLNQARHSCKPNSHAFMKQPSSSDSDEPTLEELTIILKAGMDINNGESVTFSYCPLILGTLERRPRLINSHLFWCKCIRCMDPTECGTFLSSVVCQICSIGHLSPPISLLQCSPATFVSSDIDSSSIGNWVCNVNRLGRCNRSGNNGANTTQNCISRILNIEKESMKYFGNLKFAIGFVLLHTQRNRNLINQSRTLPEMHSTFLKLYDDILRGALFPLSDFNTESLNEFDHQSLCAVKESKKRYKDVMKILNPGFNFEGFPAMTINLMLNESYIPRAPLGEESVEVIDQVPSRSVSETMELEQQRHNARIAERLTRESRFVAAINARQPIVRIVEPSNRGGTVRGRAPRRNGRVFF